jgi:hypothetical protein
MEEAGYGYWGFSPANKPEGDYGVWGVDGAGMDRAGMPSNEHATLVDHGFPGCPDHPAKPDPPQSAYTNGVVTPHAAFLALRYAPRATLANLRRLVADFPGLYGKWGFRDSVNVQTKRVSDAYLSLDQGMIMAAWETRSGTTSCDGRSRTATWNAPCGPSSGSSVSTQRPELRLFAHRSGSARPAARPS